MAARRPREPSLFPLPASLLLACAIGPASAARLPVNTDTLFVGPGTENGCAVGIHGYRRTAPTVTIDAGQVDLTASGASARFDAATGLLHSYAGKHDSSLSPGPRLTYARASQLLPETRSAGCRRRTRRVSLTRLTGLRCLRRQGGARCLRHR